MHDFHNRIFRNIWRAYPFNVPVCYVAAVEVPNPFDHTYKLRAKMECELLFGTGEYSSSQGVIYQYWGFSPSTR